MEIIKFYKYIAKLKKTRRVGWVREKMRDKEHVADHSFSSAILSMILAPRLQVNLEKTVKMLLIHDLGESIIGDIAWYTKGVGVDKEKLQRKNEQEMETMKRILKILKQDEYIQLWKEYVEGKTKEAKLAYQIDKLDIAMQAFFYEKETKKNLAHFFDFAELYIKHPLLKKIMDKMKSLRKL